MNMPDQWTSTELDPRVVEELDETRQRLDAEGNLYSQAQIAECSERFRERFGPERLASLEGEDLLQTMHGRGENNSLMYWLEFKNDEGFLDAFGGIGGGSAFNYDIFYSQSKATWMAGSARNAREISVSEAIATAVRQIVSKSVTSNEVVDIFSAAGMDKPEISILSDAFLAEVQGLPYKNLAIEALKKLLSDQIKAQAKTNLTQSRHFSEMLERAILKLQNRTLETAQIVAELVELAKQMRAAHQRGEQLGLTEDELAFYDALEVSDSAVKLLGDDTLKEIAREVFTKVRNSVTIDWNVKETAGARLRVIVKGVLRKHGYPPDKEPQAILTVLQQTELLCAKWQP